MDMIKTVFSGQAEERRQNVSKQDLSNWELSYNIKGTFHGSTVMVPGNKMNHRHLHRHLMNSYNGLNF
jgi:hypothetical protein